MVLDGRDQKGAVGGIVQAAARRSAFRQGRRLVTARKAPAPQGPTERRAGGSIWFVGEHETSTTVLETV